MARYLGPKLRLARREGENLGHKSGIRQIDTKCNIKSKPGEPAKKMRPRASDYSNHLRAKQKMRRYYCVLERQFRNYYKKAANSKGDTGTNLIEMLERRLDNVVYRMGFARTRAEARQLVSHKLILIDNKIVNIASYQLDDGEVVSLKPTARKHERVLDSINISDRTAVDFDWLSVDPVSFSGKVIGPPDKNMLGIFFDEGMVIEFYSK